MGTFVSGVLANSPGTYAQNGDNYNCQQPDDFFMPFDYFHICQYPVLWFYACGVCKVNKIMVEFLAYICNQY